MTYLEGVYWDLDGTIANTELEAHLPAFNFAFNDFKKNKGRHKGYTQKLF